MVLDQFKLVGKIAMVTGASRGLGHGMAMALAEAGADIIGVGISDSSATGDAIAALGRHYLAINADLSNTACAASSCSD